MSSQLLPRYWLLGCLWVLGLSAQAQQAPANDNPCGAIILPLNGNLCTTPTVGTNAGATPTVVAGHTSPTPGCGGSGTQPLDVWYTFRTGASGLGSFGATITVTGNPAGQLRLYAAYTCTGPFTLIGCSAASTPNTAAPRLTTGALQANTYYYVAVNGYADTDQTGAFTICVTDGPGAPTCGAPLFTGSGSVNATSAQVGFMASTSPGPYQAVLTGGGSTQTLTVTASPIQLTGLLPATTYQLTLTGQCASGPAPSAGLSFTTPTSYCTASLGGSCSANFMTSVAIIGTTLQNGAQIPVCEDGRGSGTSALQAYTFYPPTRPLSTATLLAGSSYQLSVMADALSSVSAWLDADQNGVFDVNEWTQVALVTQNGQAALATLAVPATALAGPTGLRLRSRTAGSPNTAGNACSNYLSGEVEDYIVTIARPTATTAAGTNSLVSVYPNPATNQLTITYTAPPTAMTVGQLHILDVLGREVHRQPLPIHSANTLELSVKEWPSGLYVCVFEWPSAAVYTTKVLVN